MLPFIESSLTSLVGHFKLIDETLLCLNVEKKQAVILRYRDLSHARPVLYREGTGFLTHCSVSLNDNFRLFDIVILALF